MSTPYRDAIYLDATPPRRPFARRVRRWILVGLAIVAGLTLAWRSVFVLDDTQLGWLYGGSRGSGVAVVEAGVHFKWPWQSIRRFSRQVQWREIGPIKRPIPYGGEVTLTATASWQVTAEGLAGRVRLPQDDGALATQLAAVVAQGLDRALTQHPLDQLLLGTEDAIGRPMIACLGQAVRAESGPWILERYGVELLDVSIHRLVIPKGVPVRLQRDAAARRQTEADQILLAAATQIAELRTKTQQEAEKIKRDAEAEAASIRAQGKARAARFVAEARRPELETLLSAIESYRKALDKDTTLVIEGGREFFRLLEGASATGRVPEAQSRPARTTSE